MPVSCAKRKTPKPKGDRLLYLMAPLLFIVVWIFDPNLSRPASINPDFHMAQVR